MLFPALLGGAIRLLLLLRLRLLLEGGIIFDLGFDMLDKCEVTFVDKLVMGGVTEITLPPLLP
jgi:hypothetical protein